MKTIIFRFLLPVAGLAIVYLFSARQLTLLIDRIKTTRVRTIPPRPMTLNSDSLEFGELHLVLYRDGMSPSPAVRGYEGPDKQIAIEIAGKTFRFEPDDDVSLTEERSLLSWPTPFEMNFMTGHSPSWKANRYFRFVCKKRTGARLDLLWRYEEWFYPGLGTSPQMTHEGATGLIRADLRQ